ncbi:TetR/AcrR family transcriptional regulator [Microbacterium stercoris]|uniref:TetR/AcrR family transcriptional regulator n=1 Tax=Microbacterium stercoris TaxID=2820289 RepID=A0A939TTX2_9MICO|nr:TetR/AcrR family transcriptional regulator [Microbacterium stercoris]MBO3663434.1 TetR/AcrR family transcriptional regulator [Microbacterium stercoris]
MTTDADARTQIIRAASRLFYTQGIGRVGMDAVRDAAGVSLKAIYKQFPSKEDLILGVLENLHQSWNTGIDGALAEVPSPRDRLLAVYDYLAAWFDRSDFRGCGFINAFGELGAGSPAVATAVREHKLSFLATVDALVAEAGGPAELGPQLAILAEGAQTTAAILGDAKMAHVARRAAETLIDAAFA